MNDADLRSVPWAMRSLLGFAFDLAWPQITLAQSPGRDPRTVADEIRVQSIGWHEHRRGSRTVQKFGHRAYRARSQPLGPYASYAHYAPYATMPLDLMGRTLRRTAC